jgi:bifunctional ADP-heptose synthase (sugar kinase/adenylyltransferase)
VCGVVGTDDAGDDLARELQEAGADITLSARRGATDTLKHASWRKVQAQTQQICALTAKAMPSCCPACAKSARAIARRVRDARGALRFPITTRA